MKTACLFTLLCLVWVSSVDAVINPKLQPSHLSDRYLNVVNCSVTSLDIKARTAVLKLEGVSKSVSSN